MSDSLTPNQSLLQIGSLDLFWMPRLVSALAPVARCELISTWSPRISAPPAADKAINSWALHYSLALYKRFPALQSGNYLYLKLCELFDLRFSRLLSSQCRVLYFLSGCGLFTLRAANRFNIPVIVESGSTHTDYQHQIVLDEYRRNGKSAPLFPEAYRARVRAEFHEADYIQIPSNFVRETYLEHGIPEEKLLLAHYGADVKIFATRTTNDVQDIFRVICPSGINLRKGARLLVEAWRKLGWKKNDAELHWIGWPSHPEVRHLFREPLHGVVLHGWMSHNDLCKLYRSCDALVLPSFEEGLARVLIEGAASGLALIATPNTGVEDFFTKADPEGWLISSNSVDELCSALEEAKVNRQQTFEIGQRAAVKARSSFSWDDYEKQVRNNFAKICGTSG
jgi:glycosyltransferase involved in cell wall biosynthesis